MTEQSSDLFLLNDTWTLWFHDLQSNDWTINGYSIVQKIRSIEDFWIVMNNINLNIGMYYLMRGDYKPMWDDPNNINGSNYTYKCLLNDTSKHFYNFAVMMLGETLYSTPNTFVGISTSPKSKNNIIRLWSTTAVDPIKMSIESNKLLNILEWKHIYNNEYLKK